VRLTAEQIERIVREIEALEHGEVLVRVLGPGRPVEVKVTRSVRFDRQAENMVLDTDKNTS
jgi:hypothetical protein